MNMLMLAAVPVLVVILFVAIVKFIRNNNKLAQQRLLLVKTQEIASRKNLRFSGIEWLGTGALLALDGINHKLVYLRKTVEHDKVDHVLIDLSLVSYCSVKQVQRTSYTANEIPIASYVYTILLSFEFVDNTPPAEVSFFTGNNTGENYLAMYDKALKWQVIINKMTINILKRA